MDSDLIKISIADADRDKRSGVLTRGYPSLMPLLLLVLLRMAVPPAWNTLMTMLTAVWGNHQ